MRDAPNAEPSARRLFYGVGVWVIAWLAMLALDGHVDLGNQALVLVLAAALGALWLPAALSMALGAAAVLLFNFAFVPPRGTLRVDLQQHALLLVSMLAVSSLVALLVARQRRLAARERAQHQRTRQLREFGDALRDADEPAACAPRLQAALAEISGAPATLLLADARREGTALVGEASAEERVALGLTLRSEAVRDARPGVAWYLPLRGRSGAFGAALLRLPARLAEPHELKSQAQALCDQMGLALERAAAVRAAAAAREASQTQTLRATLLAAIAHDHRTPLATILGAASSLHDQGDRLAGEQRRALAATIVDEASQLARLTDNTLQLARLDAPGVRLHVDWESIEEVVGSVVRRARQRDPAAPLRVTLAPALPLVRCDAVLLVQLLDNLVDNALRHGGRADPVEISATAAEGALRLAVADRGPGVPREWRAAIFEPFQRGPSPAGDGTRGAGVGLAVARAIARVHGGELALRERPGGGAVFELTLPLAAPPARAAEEAA